MEKEITSKTQLHNSKGHLNAPGYAKNMVFEYDRNNIKANPFALKEWDFYQITFGDWILQITIGHVSYIASFSANLISIKTGQTKAFTRLKPLPFRSMKMPLNPENPNILKAKGKDYDIVFDTKPHAKILKFKAQDSKIGVIDIDIVLYQDPDNEKMVIATPFNKKNQFYLNYKENFYDVSGKVLFGDVVIDAHSEDTAVLDWGRGVWPFKHEWFWGNGQTFVDGEKFAFNFGWGFGDLSNASENMYFWNGKAYKLGHLRVERDENNYMAPWTFKDETGHFDFTMTPVYDNFSRTKIAFVLTQCHQIFGNFDGTITLPEGKKIQINSMLAFCEHAENRW